MCRYNFNKSAKLYKAASDDFLRPLINDIYFKDGNAIATDNHVIIKAPIKEISNLRENDIKKMEGKFLNRENYKKMLSYRVIKKITSKGIVCENTYDSVVFPFTKKHLFPTMDNLEKKMKGDPLSHVYIIPKHLENLCEAVGMQESSCRLGFNGKNNNISVTFPDSDIKGIMVVCADDSIEKQDITKENDAGIR